MPPRPKRNTKKVDYSKFADSADQHRDDSDADEEVKESDFQGHEESDVDMDDSVPDEVDEGLEEQVERIEEVIGKEKKKGPKNKAMITKKASSVSASPKPVNEVPKKEIRLTRQIVNVREKFFRLFGSNKEKLIEVVRLRRDFEKAMFDFPSSKLKEYLPSIVIENVPKVKSNKLTKSQFYEKFPIERSINFRYNENPTEALESGRIISNNRALIINTGGLITDIAWLTHGSETEEQILAVAVSDITDTTVASAFSLLGGKSYRSGFLIYALDTQSYTLRLIKAVTHPWGNSWDLQWKNHTGIGVLSAVFNDGKLRLLSFDYDDEDELTYTEITAPSVEYSLPGMMISSFDWIGDKIVCATDKGYVAEFILNDPIPSYVYPIHTGYIFSIRSGESKYDETLVLTSGADGSSALFSTVDIGTTKHVTPKSKSLSKYVVYSPQLYSFIQVEAQYAAKLLPARALFVSTPVVKHDGSTESMATSNLHPMFLSGGADGRIKITNLSRRLLNGQKQTLSNHKIMTLWELQYSERENVYRLVDNLEVETLSANDNSNVANIYPPGVSFNSIKWNENENAGKWYAAASTSGLLIVERLQEA